MRSINSQASPKIAEVIEAATAQFTAQSYELYGLPPLGGLVKTGDIYGVVCHAETAGMEPGRRPIARGKDEATEAAVYDASPQLLKLLRSEFTASVVGYKGGDKIYQYLPPQPARIHSFVYVCQPEEVRVFSSSFDFLNILLNASPVVPPEEVIAATLRQMAGAQDDPRAFLVAAGKELANMLSADFVRLKNILGEAEMTDRLGIVTNASLEKGVDVRLDAAISVEDMVVGRYVTIQGRQRRFFGMITDVSLNFTDDRLSISPPDVADPFIAEVLSGTSTFGTIHVTPMLTIGGDAKAVLEGPQPVKTIPAHFSTVNLASEGDIESVFGKEDKERFSIGNPLDMETKLCLNLEEFARRSNGIFGKSGTGKTFLTRILLIGMLQKSKAVNLIFDMHSEYGWAGTREGGGTVKGLKQLFPDKVAVFTLDEMSSKRRKVSTDFVVKIGLNEITPEDIAILRATLNLTDLAVEAAYQLRKILGRDWLNKILNLPEEEVAELLKGADIHESSFQSLKRGLGTIGRLGFVVPEAKDEAVKVILDYLQSGRNVVLEFGRYQEIAAYLLVANMLSRRIYSRYQQQMEEAIAEDDEARKPRPLVITIEEAHKFLDNEVADKTIFGTIAREMRKYNVTLLVIDQRPSGISEEVMSQLGTKITCLLDNERDIDSVLAGVSGKNELKAVLSRLAPRQQALIFGHAVPMPVAFQPVAYDAKFYAGLNKKTAETGGKDIEKLWE